jgi:hypothetical protein
MTRRQKRHQPPRIARGLVLPNRPNPKTRPRRGDRKEPQVFPLRCAAGCFCLLFPFAVGPVEAWTDAARGVPPTLWEAPTTHCCAVAVSEETATAVEAQSTSGCLGTRHD